ncbi:hypothetical protein ABK040_001489 [Willaertia magna]
MKTCVFKTKNLINKTSFHSTFKSIQNSNIFTKRHSHYYLGDNSDFQPLLLSYLNWKSTFSHNLKECLEKQPKNLMANVIKFGSELLATDRPLHHPSYLSQLKTVQELSKNSNQPTEQLHVKALESWQKGYYHEAVKHWEEIIAKDPLDAVAVKFVHDAYFYLGQNTEMMRSIENVIEKYEKSNQIPKELYGYLCGMYAFGLEEAYDFDKAEKYALKALEINKTDAWAVHAMAHVKEMRGDIEGGIKFMLERENDWKDCDALACHNYWHYCLYLIDQGKYDEVIKIYDEKIAKYAEGSSAPLDLVDASSLLFRLLLDNKISREDDRFKKLRKYWSPMLHSHALAFNDLHIQFTLTRPKNDEESHKIADEHLKSMTTYTNYENNEEIYKHTNKNVTKLVGLSLCKAVDAFYLQDYDQVLTYLLPIVMSDKNRMLGGSNAQRDILELLLIHAYCKATDKFDKDDLRNIVEVRRRRKPHSDLNKRLRDMIDAVPAMEK